MTNDEWINYARIHQDKLTSLIRDWHPRLRLDKVGDITTTALGAERACEGIRESIKTKDSDKPNPLIEFKNALITGNVSVINCLLNDTWFGVPESRSCWEINGFKECVWLIESPPE